ncbi:hypothetical protein MWU60_10965 [Yoonia sp. F2084L]|uniref:hypothetical protein n=1 Tax=Yoonia sp. F2084L TaxID=2926419 RepID=UPI001FF6EE11|nr:hypothetical protein [Yoonia sp. F2084L]MCK0096091.1 hypothetical protein [Yoonia sp. F2084L]
MKSLLLAAALATVSAQAQALSCMRPDPIRTFQQVAAAPESYYVLYGQLRFDEADLPVRDLSQQLRNPEPITARFEGKGLTRQGFTSDYQSDVMLQIDCASIWCGGARSGVDAVYFVRVTEPLVTMYATPCGDMIFEEPSQATLDMLTTCMQGGDCSPQPF